MGHLCSGNVWGTSLVVFLIGLSLSSAQDATTSTTNTPEPPLDWYECPDQYSYHNHPGNCTQYIICVFGKAYLRWCEGGLNWNDQLKICDWPNKKTLCQQVDANTAYRPESSPVMPAPSFPQQSESETAMLNSGDPNEMPKSFQNFSPDEDAAKSQLTQYAGKQVVYHNRDSAGPSRDAADPSLQQDGSQQYDKFSPQNSPPPSKSQNRQDGLQPLRAPNMQAPRGPPQKMSSWDTGNEDYPPQSQPSRNQPAVTPPKMSPPPSSDQPAGVAGNPPPWLAMAMQKKIKAPSAEEFRLKARGPPRQSAGNEQQSQSGSGDQQPMREMSRRPASSDMDHQSPGRPEAAAPPDQSRGGPPPSDQQRRVAPPRPSPQQPSRDSSQFSQSSQSVKPQSYPEYPSSDDQSSPPRTRSPAPASDNSARRYQQMYQGPPRGGNDNQSSKRNSAAPQMNRESPQDSQQGSRFSPQSMGRPSTSDADSDSQSQNGFSRQAPSQNSNSVFPQQSNQGSRTQGDGRPPRPSMSSSSQDQRPSSGQDFPQRRGPPSSEDSESPSGAFRGMARGPQSGASNQLTQSNKQGIASENLWNQIRSQPGQEASGDNQQQVPQQSRAPPSGGNNAQRSQSPSGGPSSIHSPFASFGFGGQQDSKRPSSSDSDDDSGPMPSNLMKSGPPQPQGFSMSSMSSRGRPSSGRPTDADNPQSVNTPSRSDQQSGGFADGSPIQDQINRMRSRFPSSSDDDETQGSNRQPSRQQGPSLEETVNRWGGFDGSDQGGSQQQQPQRPMSGPLRFTGDDNDQQQSSAPSDYDVQRFYVGV